jgi:hypothetical protein
MAVEPQAVVPIGQASRPTPTQVGPARPADGAGCAWLPVTPAGYAEKVRAQFLSLRQYPVSLCSSLFRTLSKSKD